MSFVPFSSCVVVLAVVFMLSCLISFPAIVWSFLCLCLQFLVFDIIFVSSKTYAWQDTPRTPRGQNSAPDPQTPFLTSAVLRIRKPELRGWIWLTENKLVGFGLPCEEDGGVPNFILTNPNLPLVFFSTNECFSSLIYE